MVPFKLFYKEKRGLPLIASADEMGSFAHSVQSANFEDQAGALAFACSLVERGGEAITLSRGSERIAAGPALKKLARGN